MYVKKQIYEKIIMHYNSLADTKKWDIRRNKQSINSLAEEQQVLKKELKIIYATIRNIKKSK